MKFDAEKGDENRYLANEEYVELLTKAKEIIKKLYSHIFQGMCFVGINDYNVHKAEAEQFISEVEKPIELSVDHIIEQNKKKETNLNLDYFSSDW